MEEGTETPEGDDAEVGDEEAPRKTSRWRLLALGALFFGSLLVAHWTGLTQNIDVETIRSFMDAAGALGFVVFLIAFAAGELMHVPGLVFVGAASVAYGEVLGSFAAYAGALLSVTVSFFVVRLIGGQPLGEVKRPLARRILSRLDDHPLRTVAILRFFFWMAPPLNYALAMSKVRYRDYLAGSAIGLLLPIPLAVLFFDWLAEVSLGEWISALF